MVYDEEEEDEYSPDKNKIFDQETKNNQDQIDIEDVEQVL